MENRRSSRLKHAVTATRAGTASVEDYYSDEEEDYYSNEDDEDDPEEYTGPSAPKARTQRRRANQHKPASTAGSAPVEDVPPTEPPHPPAPRMLAPIPDGAEPLYAGKRLPGMVEVYTIPQHDLVVDLQVERGAKIYLLVYERTQKTMTGLFDTAAKWSPPKSLREAHEQGYPILLPSKDDRLVFRDKYGSGLDKDDHLVSWSLGRHELPAERIAEFQQLQSDILGDPSKMSAEKPTRNDDGSWEGGVEFQRSDRAACLRNGPGCHPLSVSFQVPKSMSGPAAHNKVYSLEKDEDATMRFNILKYGSQSSMQGLRKAGDDFMRRLETQASFTNLPRVGTDDNIAHPAYQINIAAAHEPSDASTSEIKSLGKFGGSHVDSGDASQVPSAMTVLSPHSDEIEPEVFYLMDFGIGWLMEEFSTIYFSGLHLHGGSQPTYKADRVNKESIYYRLTLIAYPPNEIISGHDALAFAALPNKTLLPVGYQLRNPATSHILSARTTCTQATYTADGPSIFEPKSQLRHFTRTVCELLMGLVQQAPPTLMLRMDPEPIIAAFTGVVDGIRVQAPPWEHAPGWPKKDVQVGTNYNRICEDKFNMANVEELAKEKPKLFAQLYNSDNHETTFPFDREDYGDALTDWEENARRYAVNVPLLNAIDELSGFGGRIGGKAKALVSNSRKDDAEEMEKKPRQKRKRKDEDSEVDGRPCKCQKKGHHEEEDDGNGSYTRGHPRFESEEPHTTLQPQIASFREAIPANLFESSKPPIMSCFYLPALSKAEDELSKSLSGPSSNSGITPVLSVIKNVASSPLTRQTRGLLHAFGNAMTVLEYQTSFLHAQSIAIDFLFFRGLEKKIETSWPYNQSDPTDPGVALLVKAVFQALTTPSSKSTLDASDHFKGFTRGESTHIIETSNRKRHQSPNMLEVFDRVLHILYVWFGPDRIWIGPLLPRMWFTRELVVLLGPHVLVVPGVAYAIRHLHSDVLQVGRNKIVNRELITDWIDMHLKPHPVCTRASPHSESLAEISRSVSVMLAGEDIFAEVSSCIEAPLTLGEPFQPSVSGLGMGLCPKQREADNMVRLIHATIPFLSSPLHAPASPASDPTEAMLHDALIDSVNGYRDQRLPFRNFAKSRMHVLADPDGPYSARWRKTLPGYFSAILYRGITHSTPFLWTHKTLFKDLEDWKATVNESLAEEELPNDVRDDAYFCNKAAYGQSTCRSRNHADEYWRLVQKPELHKWILQEEPADFFTIFKLIADTFPAFGGLTAAQFTIDQVECGNVAMPSLDEMGELIYRLKLGALEGLRDLGFKIGNKTQSAQALKKVDEFLKSRLSEEVMVQIDYGVIFLEHLLCKVHRLRYLPYTNYYAHFYK